jgi:FAD synthetase
MHDSEDITAAVIVIGDEILKGKILDTNSGFLSRRLYRIGVKLCRISVVADDVDKIATEIKLLANEHSFVITAGGIGPTHDDVTYTAVAQAFDEKLTEHAELSDIMRDLFPMPESCADVANPALKMALVPESAQLHYLHKSSGLLDSPFPVISCHNVFIFPGASFKLIRIK